MRNGVLLCVLVSLTACDRSPWGSTGSGRGTIVLGASDVQVLGTLESIAAVADLERCSEELGAEIG